MYEVLTGNRAWDGIPNAKILIFLHNNASPFEKGWEQKLNKDLVELILGCCEHDYNQRINSKVLLNRLKEIEELVKKDLIVPQIFDKIEGKDRKFDEKQPFSHFEELQYTKSFDKKEKENKSLIYGKKNSKTTANLK